MGNLLYIIAVILVIIWAIAFFGGYASGGIIHILLVIAIIAVLLKLIRETYKSNPNHWALHNNVKRPVIFF